MPQIGKFENQGSGGRGGSPSEYFYAVEGTDYFKQLMAQVNANRQGTRYKFVGYVDASLPEVPADMRGIYNTIDNSSSDPVYRAWLADAGQQALVKNGDRSPTSPNFLAFKEVRGSAGEWLSPEQIFQKEQANQLRDQAALDAELRPFILESMGLRTNAQGTLEKIPPPELTPEQLKEKELEDLYKEHLTAAQEGRLPVSLATQSALKEQEAILNETMSRKLGTNWQESTQGVKQQSRYFLSSEATKEAERHGELEKASGLLNQRQASISDITQRQLGLLEGASSPTYSLVNAYGTGQQPYLFNNLLSNQRNAYEANVQNTDRAGKIGLIGSAIGGAGAGYMYYNNMNNQPNNDPNYNPKYNPNTNYWVRN